MDLSEPKSLGPSTMIILFISFWSLQFFWDKPIFWLSHPLLKAPPSSTPFPYVLTFLTKAWHQERRHPESQHQEDQWTYGCLTFSNSKWHVNQ